MILLWRRIVQRLKRPANAKRAAKRWTRINDIKAMTIAALMLAGCFSGVICLRWSMFDGCNLWNDKYPHTPRSKALLWLLRIATVLEYGMFYAHAFAWIVFRRATHRSPDAASDSSGGGGIASDNSKKRSYIQVWQRWLAEHGTPKWMNRWFVAATLLDLYRALLELLAWFAFHALYVPSVAVRPPNRHTLSWLVDLSVEGVIGLVPWFCWLLPPILSLAALATVSSVWEEASEAQRFHRSYGALFASPGAGYGDEEGEEDVP